MSDNVIIFFGDYLSWVLAIGLILFVLIQDYKKRSLIVIEALIAGVVSRFGITEIIRFFYNKPRPFESLENFRMIIEQDPGGSFPSGHAAFFFALSSTLFIYNKNWGVIFFVAASLMGVARVMAGVHWGWDIVGGAAVGVIASVIIHWLVGKFRM